MEAGHGGTLAARALLDSGIDVLFALPGGHNLPLFEGARLRGLRLIDTRHEENAVMMAEGHALATARVAAAAVTMIRSNGVVDGRLPPKAAIAMRYAPRRNMSSAALA